MPHSQLTEHSCGPNPNRTPKPLSLGLPGRASLHCPGGYLAPRGSHARRARPGQGFPPHPLLAAFPGRRFVSLPSGHPRTHARTPCHPTHPGPPHPTPQASFVRQVMKFRNGSSAFQPHPTPLPASNHPLTFSAKQESPRGSAIPVAGVRTPPFTKSLRLSPVWVATVATKANNRNEPKNKNREALHCTDVGCAVAVVLTAAATAAVAQLGSGAPPKPLSLGRGLLCPPSSLVSRPRPMPEPPLTLIPLDSSQTP